MTLRNEDIEMLAPSIMDLHDLETGATGFIKGAKAVFVELARSEAQKAAEVEGREPDADVEEELEILRNEEGDLESASYKTTREELSAVLGFFTKHTKNIPNVDKEDHERFWGYLSHTELLLAFGQYMVEYQKLHKL